MSSPIRSMLVWSSDVGAAIVDWVGVMNLWTAALFVVAFALDRLLASRVSAALRALFYLPIVLRLVLPSAWSIALPVLQPKPTGMLLNAVAATVRVDPGAALIAADPVPASVSWLIAVPLTYMAVAAWLIVRWRRECRRLGMILVESSSAPAWLRGLARDFDIVEHASAGPILIGARFPRLVLPAGIARRIGEEGVRAIVRHEASHVRRRDPLVAAVLHALVIGVWPVVAVWCGASRVRTLLEIACDERALSGADANERRIYGRTLIDVASGRSASRVALGFGDSLHERIASLRSSSRRWSRAGQALATLAVLAGVVACSSTRVEHAGASTEDGVAVGAPQETHHLQFQVLSEVEGAESGRSLVAIKLPDLSRYMLQRDAHVLSAPSLITFTGQEASIEVGDDSQRMRIEANVIRLEAGTRTLTLRFSELAGDAITYQADQATLLVPEGVAIEMPVEGKLARSVIVSIRDQNEKASRVPILADIPLVGNLFRKDDQAGSDTATDEAESFDPMQGDYPQVMCMMNLIEADGPLYFAKDNVIEQGRNDGSGHRVQAGELTEKTFDWFRRMKGYRNVAAPAVLVRLGSEASVSIGSTDKSGASVADNSVTVQFAESDGQLHATVRWSVKAEDGLQLDGYTASDVKIASDGAILVILPELKSTPKHGRILMLRPTLIRSVKEYPFQRD
ncbi:MAG: hypothetical protein JNL80_17590 [Phycisphaerae bacterium]|nr:hypothetical protein [Phycisphaerae bacterium]